MSAFPVLSAEKNVDLNAGCLVRFVYGGDDRYYPHSHDYYEIFITATGIVRHMVNGVVQELSEGSLVFIRPDDLHSHMCDGSEGGETSFINLTFTKETAEQLIGYLFEKSQADSLLFGKMPPVVLLDRTNKNKLISMINELNTENWKDKEAQKLRMRVILVNLFSYFINSAPDEDESSVPVWISKLTEKMSKPENFVQGIQRMVDLSGKSREHLSRTIKKYYGITITDFVNDLRINYASNLLINTNIPVIDVCFACGFQSLSYFYRVFRDKNSISPNQFRSRHKIMNG